MDSGAEAAPTRRSPPGRPGTGAAGWRARSPAGVDPDAGRHGSHAARRAGAQPSTGARCSRTRRRRAAGRPPYSPAPRRTPRSRADCIRAFPARVAARAGSSGAARAAAGSGGRSPARASLGATPGAGRRPAPGSRPPVRRPAAGDRRWPTASRPSRSRGRSRGRARARRTCRGPPAPPRRECESRTGKSTAVPVIAVRATLSGVGSQPGER